VGKSLGSGVSGLEGGATMSELLMVLSMDGVDEFKVVVVDVEGEFKLPCSHSWSRMLWWESSSYCSGSGRSSLSSMWIV